MRVSNAHSQTQKPYSNPPRLSMSLAQNWRKYFPITIPHHAQPTAICASGLLCNDSRNFFFENKQGEGKILKIHGYSKDSNSSKKMGFYTPKHTFLTSRQSPKSIREHTRGRWGLRKSLTLAITWPLIWIVLFWRWHTQSHIREVNQS